MAAGLSAFQPLTVALGRPPGRQGLGLAAGSERHVTKTNFSGEGGPNSRGRMTQPDVRVTVVADADGRVMALAA